MRNLLGLRAIPEIEYHHPTELNEALKLLRELKRNCKIVAGGTDLVPATRRGLVSFPKHGHAVDITGIKELDHIVEDSGMVRIGATTRVSDIVESVVVKKHVPILAEAANQLGSLQIRNLGTIGGNLCNASPAADTAPPLLVLDAKVNVESIDGQRSVPLTGFFTGPGQTILIPGEILTEIQVPIPGAATGLCFIKLGRRNAFTLSIVSLATLVRLKDATFDDVRIALGAVAPTPIRASKGEEYLNGEQTSEQAIDKGAKIVAGEVKPISDIRANEDYRRDMSYILTKRAINLSVQRARD